MVIMTFWAFFCLFQTIHGLRDWLPFSMVTVPLVNNINEKLSSQELKTDNQKGSAEVSTINNYFTELTALSNAASKEVTNPMTTDTAYDYSNLVLTTAINVLRKEKFSADLNITQNYINTEYFKRTISVPKNFRTIHQVSQPFKDLRDSYPDSVFLRSELNSLETTTDEYEYRVHTSARRIFHGHKTQIKHFPFLVTVHVAGRFVCGGAIIKSNLVITAAACLKSLKSNWQKWMRHTTSTTTPASVSSEEITTDTITTDINETDGANTVPSTNTVPETTETTTEKPEHSHSSSSSSSEDPGKSSSYEITAPPTTKRTDPPYITPPTDTPAGVLSVRIGTNYYRLGGKVVDVSQVFFHPSYNAKNLQNNLVILRLVRKLSFKRRRVRKINITTAVNLRENTNVTIAGWGAKTYHNKVFNGLWNLIHKTVMTVSPRHKCAVKYPKKSMKIIITLLKPQGNENQGNKKKKVTNTNFCALNEHHEGACNRDEGNPAVAGGLLVGIVSFVPPECGARDSPTVFTNIGYYAKWIQQIMAKTKSSKESSSREKPKNETSTTDKTNTDAYDERSSPGLILIPELKPDDDIDPLYQLLPTENIEKEN